MPNNQNTLFSTKGFYIGVAIFILGLSLMISRVALEVNSFTKEEAPIIKSDSISDNIKRLQEKLDSKIQEQENPEIEDKLFNPSIKEGDIQVFEHNPVLNNKGIISVIEFIDYGCPTCLVDANFAHRILEENKNIKLISKIHNTSENNQLHIANIAALIAAKNNSYFKFKDLQIKSTDNSLNQIINNLEKSSVSLRSFRNSLNSNTDTLLNNLSQDINQANKLKVKTYTVFINNRMFSDAPESKYNLKDITVYLNNL